MALCADEGSLSSDDIRVFGNTTEAKARIAERLAAYKRAASYRPDLVFQNADAIRAYLKDRNSLHLLC